MTYAILFVLGLAVGSFLNVISLRYDPDRFLITKKTVGGRSACPACRTTLRWFELIPLLSFILQGGRCRHCHHRLTLQYPVGELLSALIFVLVPWRLWSGPEISGSPGWVVAAWIAVFLALQLSSFIDFRLKLIPDELTIFIAVCGVLISWYAGYHFGPTRGSAFGPYALLFGLRSSFLLNRLAAIAAAVAVFGGIIAATLGRGMGLGDLKLAAALSLVFGWPDIIGVIVVAFIIGAASGAWKLLRRSTTWKSSISFGPFLSLASFVVFLWGESIVRFYFGLFRF